MRPLMSILRCGMVLLLTMLASVASAQTVEYTIPTDYELVPGRLSVTFADTLSEEAARAALSSLGYAVADSSRFAPVVVEARGAAPLSAEVLAALRARTEVERAALLAPSGDGAPYTLLLHLQPTVTPEAAGALIGRHAPPFTLVSFQKAPSELVIVVPPAEDEEAFERLGAHPLVRYVAYLVAE